MSSPWVIHPRTFSLLIRVVARQHAECWLTGAILLGMSRYEPEPAQESSRTFTVVLLSLLILTVIGALFGYILGLRDIDENKSTAGDGPSVVPATSKSGGKSSANPVPPQPCPGFIGVAAKQRDSGASLPLQLVLYIRTGEGQEAWICQEADKSGLWYQGHEKKNSFFDDGEIPKEGENGLLLGGVTAAGSGRNTVYTAVNSDDGRTTRYEVSRAVLKVSGGQDYQHTVIQANPPA